MDNPFKSPRIISFCPGILGLERGLARAGVNSSVMAYVEIEAFIIANLVTGMESGLLDPAPIWTDAKTFDALPFRGKIHGIIGGYPCPGESLAGLRQGHLYKGFIWPAIRRAIAAARPIWCYFENVDDHLTGTFPIVQRSLYNLGYSVEAGIFTAEEVGAPHERKRLFILAMQNSYVTRLRGIDQFEFFKELIGTNSEMANSDIKRLQKWNNCKTKTKRTSSAATGNCEKMGNDNSERLQSIGAFSFQDPENEGRDKIQPGIARTSTTLWPKGQGIEQYEWEEPRTVESRMGCTINGYNFREDLLRALGNSVVEQTCELAFITLLKKLLKHSS